MLYSKEILLIHNIEKEVFLYLKNTRNHSYRITPNKISLTLPNVYKNADTIHQYKNELLVQVRERLAKDRKWLSEKRLLDYDEFWVYNQCYTLIHDSAHTASLRIDFNQKTIMLPEKASEKDKAKLHRQLINYYQDRVVDRVKQWNKITISQPLLKVAVKNNQSSWGLCSNRGEITISLNTLFAPLWVLDYVIIHELCHLVHHDHSPNFWNLVERYYPKYKLAKKFLKEIGPSLIC